MAVGTLPIRPVVMPSDLAGKENGKLPSGILVTVGPSGQLHHVAARAYNALAFKCMSVRLPLTYTYGGTYRNYASQEQLFRQRYSPNGQHGGCKVWNKQMWCKQLVNGRVPAGAAVPGKSNHGWGLAVDTAFDSDMTDGIGPDDAVAITGHPQWPQFKEWVLLAGFSWESSDEPWHIRYVKGDVVTQFVLDIEAFIAGVGDGGKPPPVTPAPEPKPPLPPATTETWMERSVRQLATIRPGAKDTDYNSDVRRMQGLLLANGSNPGTNDGIYTSLTSATGKALTQFQKAHAVQGGADGICGQYTWVALLGA